MRSSSFSMKFEDKDLLLSLPARVRICGSSSQLRGKFRKSVLHLAWVLVLLIVFSKLHSGRQGPLSRSQQRPQVNAPALQKEDITQNITLDFVVAGFPKCGTTSLLHSFLKHNETMIAPVEFCGLNGVIDPDKRIGMLDEILAKMPSELPVQRGIKCPRAISDTTGIQLISSQFKHTKIIVGLRHPVLFFQSFYNYRVTEMYKKLDIEKPPSPFDLIGSNKWRGVSTDLARYELSLMQLAKTPMSSDDLSELGGHGKRLSPTPLSIFLYSIEQLNDSNEGRASNFRTDLQRFLGLRNPLEPFPKSNINRVRHGESINICEPRFNELRNVLTEQGKNTAQWIHRKLLESEDIFVGGHNHFIKLINEWGYDPCLKRELDHYTNSND